MRSSTPTSPSSNLHCHGYVFVSSSSSQHSRQADAQSPFVYDIVLHFGMFRTDSIACLCVCVCVSVSCWLAEFRSLFGGAHLHHLHRQRRCEMFKWMPPTEKTTTRKPLDCATLSNAKQQANVRIVALSCCRATRYLSSIS